MNNNLTKNIPENRRSVIRQLEDLLPQIEDGLARGYSHAEMHAALPDLGINVSLGYYHRMLHKLRTEKRGGTKAPRTQDLLQASAQPQPEASFDQKTPQSKKVELTSALVDGTSAQSANMEKSSGDTTFAKYRGRALLDRDFSNF